MRKTCAVVALVALTVASVALAQEKFDPAAAAKAVAPFVNARTIMVAHADVSQVDINALAGWVTGMMKKIDPQEFEREAKDLDRQAEIARQWVADFTKAGGRHIYMVAGMPDFPMRPPLIIVPLAPGAKADVLAGLITTGQARPPATGPAAQEEEEERPSYQQRLSSIELHGAVVAGFSGTLERLKTQEAAQSVPQIEAAFAAAGDGPAQGMLLVTAEVRKFAVNLLAGELPAEIGGGSPAPITEGIQWIAMGVQIPPKPVSGVLTIQSRNAQDAAALTALVDKAAQTLSKNAEMTSIFDVLKVYELLKPTVDADKLVLRVDDARYNKVLELVVPGIQRAQSRARAASNMHQIRWALYMYAQQHKDQLPAALSGEDLEELSPYGLNERLLVNPIHPERKPGYIYVRYPRMTSKTATVPNPIVLYEAYDKWEDGINVCFLDGSVQFIADQAKFERMLKESQDAAAELMKGNAGKP